MDGLKSELADIKREVQAAAPVEPSPDGNRLDEIEMMQRPLRECGFDADEKIEGFDGFDPDRQKTAAARTDVRQMLDAIHNWRSGKTPFLTLVGNPGVGKTRLIKAAVMALKERGERPYYITAYDFDKRVKDFRDQAGTHDGWIDPDVWVERLAKVEWLALDDIGAGYIDKGWTRSRFERLIDLRYRAERPTLIASNISGPAFINAMGDRVYSRLWDGRIGKVIVMAAALDFRPALEATT